jgi:integrase/recombinase XerD
MKPYESFLAPYLNEYLAYREELGYALQPSQGSLRMLDRHLHRAGATWSSLQPSFFLDMRNNLPLQAVSVNHVLSVARGFFRYLVRRGICEKNPLLDVPPLREELVVPYIFSPEQVDQFLQSVCKRMRRHPSTFIKELALYMAMLLMARCGLRISEPLRLLKHHYRKEEGTIYIEKTKFSKDRLLPLPKAVIQEMENYLSVRRDLSPHDQNPYLLAGKDNKPLHDEQVSFLFRKVIQDMGIPASRKKLGNVIFNPPTSHSLRHSFAVNTLRAVRKRGQSPQHALPMLAAYLGHCNYVSTTVYLKVADADSRQGLYDFAIWQRGKL